MARLADIIEALETASDERRDYLNRQTGEIHSIDLEVFRFKYAKAFTDVQRWLAMYPRDSEGT